MYKPEPFDREYKWHTRKGDRYHIIYTGRHHCRFPVIVSLLYKSSGGSASDASVMDFSTGEILFADKILVTNKVTTGPEFVSTCICG